MPDLFVSIDNKLIDENNVSNLTYGNSYILTCIARDSRPSVELNFYDIFNNRINLAEYAANTVSNIQKSVNCNLNTLCTSILSLSLTFNDERLKSSSMITCEAKNTTKLFEISTLSSFNVHVIVPQSNFF